MRGCGAEDGAEDTPPFPLADGERSRVDLDRGGEAVRSANVHVPGLGQGGDGHPAGEGALVVEAAGEDRGGVYKGRGDVGEGRHGGVKGADVGGGGHVVDGAEAEEGAGDDVGPGGEDERPCGGRGEEILTWQEGLLDRIQDVGGGDYRPPSRP